MATYFHCYFPEGMENDQMTDAEKDWASAKMVRNMYQDVDSVHAHTIIALCLMLDKYLQPKLECQKKLSYAPETQEPGPVHSGGGANAEGQGNMPTSPERFECWAGPDLV